MQTVSDIMTDNILTCTDMDTLLDGHRLMKENNIRHVPVVSKENGHYVGMLTHKEVLKQAFQITDVHGTNRLDRYESKIKIKDIMTEEIETIAPDLPLDQAGNFFLTSKQGCLPVCKDNEVIGILTSVDFVKLSMTLLKTL